MQCLPITIPRTQPSSQKDSVPTEMGPHTHPHRTGTHWKCHCHSKAEIKGVTSPEVPHGRQPSQSSPWGLRIWNWPCPWPSRITCCGQGKPVCAIFTSQTPGPAAYRQTDVQVTKFKAPQYTMAARVEPPGDKTLKPGPGAHSPEKVWEQQTRGVGGVRDTPQEGRRGGVHSAGYPKSNPSVTENQSHPLPRWQALHPNPMSHCC